MSHTRAADRRIAVLAAAVAAAALGVAALLRLPQAGRHAAGPLLVAQVEDAGLPRAAMLEEATRPLERRLSSLPGVAGLESRTDDGRALLALSTATGTDADRLHLAVLRALQGPEAPPGRITFELHADPRPAVQLALLGGGSRPRRSRFVREVLLPELARVHDAGRIAVLGEAPLRIAVQPSAAALLARGLTPLDLVERLRSVGAPIAAGRVRDGAELRPLALRERIGSPRQLGEVEVRGPAGTTPLAALATIAPREIEDASYLRLDGEDGILLQIERAPGGDGAALARGVAEHVAALAARPAARGFQLALLPPAEEDAPAPLGRFLLAVIALLGLSIPLARIACGSWGPALAGGAAGLATFLAAPALLLPGRLPLDLPTLTVFGFFALLSAGGALLVSAASAPGAGAAPQRSLDPVAAIASLFLGGVGWVAALGAYAAGAIEPGRWLAALGVAILGAVLAVLLPRALGATQPDAARPTSPDATPAEAPAPPAGTPFGQRSPTPAAAPAGGARRFLARHPSFPYLALPALLVTAALATALALAAAHTGARGAAGSRVALAFEPADDPTPARARALGAQLESAVLATLGKVRPVERVLSFDPGDGDLLAPLRQDERGRLDLTFADAAAARDARRLLAGALGRMPGLWVRFAAAEPVEIAAEAPTEIRAAALAGEAARAAASLPGCEPQALPGRSEPAPLDLRWNDAIVARGNAGDPALTAQVRAGLGNLDAGTVEIQGVEPEVWVGPTLPDDLALLPVRPAGEATSAAARAVPLGALARVERRLANEPLWRRNGRPIVRLRAPGGCGARRAELTAALSKVAPEPGESLTVGAPNGVPELGDERPAGAFSRPGALAAALVSAVILTLALPLALGAGRRRRTTRFTATPGAEAA